MFKDTVIASPFLEGTSVKIDLFETKDGRTPKAIVAYIGGLAVPLTFDYRTIRYVERVMREFSASEGGSN